MPIYTSIHKYSQNNLKIKVIRNNKKIIKMPIHASFYK